MLAPSPHYAPELVHALNDRGLQLASTLAAWAVATKTFRPIVADKVLCLHMIEAVFLESV